MRIGQKLGLALLALYSVSGCVVQPVTPNEGANHVVDLGPIEGPDDGLDLGAYPPSGALQCVPFARQVSGIDIYGDAYTWWQQAVGRFQRADDPVPGAVLVLSKTPQLPRGHVAVVVDQIDERNILVTQANWGSTPNTRGTIHERQPAQDVSTNNDWSAIRFMNLEGSYGKVYPAEGFILPPKEDEHLRTAAK